jgi:hypothetical protein
MVALVWLVQFLVHNSFMLAVVVVAHKLEELVELEPLEVEMVVWVQPLELLVFPIQALVAVAALMAVLEALAS